jgi:hypothetical protein
MWIKKPLHYGINIVLFILEPLGMKRHSLSVREPSILDGEGKNCHDV